MSCKMYCTIVNFAATYEDGISIDSCLSREWTVQRAYYDLMGHASSESQRAVIFDSMPPDVRKVVDDMGAAFSGMTMRARLNGDRINGPHTLYTEGAAPDDDTLLAWAKMNVFKKPKKGKKK